VTWCLFVLAFGLMIGSFINVLVARLPFEKSILWPSSRCFKCYRPIRFTDNIPILGYLRLGGKCRYCHEPFSARYLWVELGTGAAFLALFLTEIVFDRFHLPGVAYDPRGFGGAAPSGRALAVFAYHAFLLSALIAAAVVDAEHRIIPTSITYTALAVGLIGGALMPWPWPYPAATVAQALPAHITSWSHPDYLGKIPTGVQLWPFWGPTFDFAPPGSWKLGLLNSVLGALVGSLVIRATKWTFETGLGREAMGLGDADLLMMAGAFLGWQIAVLSLFVGAFAAILLKALEVVMKPDAPSVPPGAPTGTPVTGQPDARELPFGPGLAIGVVVTWFAWPWFAPKVQSAYFDAVTMGVFVVVMGVGLLAASLLLRRSAEPVPEPAK
jgi:leader peptidase (prepilin peptidase)/N-methyltransferase